MGYVTRRPRHLNVWTMHFPLPSIISILHRVSGIVLFLLIPFLLWALHCSLDAEGFEGLYNGLNKLHGKVILWLLFLPFLYHMLAGVRHLLLDARFMESREGGRKTALFTLILFGVIAVLIGVYLW